MTFPLFDMILIAGRMGGMIFTAPIFGSRNYPVQLKIGLMFFLTLLVYPLVPSDVSYDMSSILSIALLLAGEILTGVLMGLILTVYFNFIYFAGALIDRDIGFAMVNVINPLDESQIAVTSNFFYVFATFIFLHLNLHHGVITGLVNSFNEIKLGTNILAVNSFSILLDIIAQSFVYGFQIAAPFVITVLISNIILGLLAKAMPGMNVFILGMPFKIFFGFLIFIVIMPFLYEVFGGILKDSFVYLERLFELYNP